MADSCGLCFAADENAERCFDHDDGIIDEDADAEDEREERDAISA